MFTIFPEWLVSDIAEKPHDPQFQSTKYWTIDFPKWRFPKIGVPLLSSIFRSDFPL